MNANSEANDKGKTPSTDEKTEAARNTGGKSSGAGLTNTLGDSTEQRVGDAGSFAPISPASTTENKKTTRALLAQAPICEQRSGRDPRPD